MENIKVTAREIRDVISKLEKQREILPQHSYFGDDNWVSIDSAREALEWVLGGMDAPVSDEELT